MTPASFASTSHPASDDGRLSHIDFIRGVAVCGILFVNIFAYGLPGLAYMTPGIWHVESGLDRAAYALVATLVTAKFYAMFSMLFGAGLILQSQRLDAREAPTTKLMTRRLLVLLGVGLLHALLFWFGDILFFYAIIGFFVFIMRGLSAATLRNIGLGLLIVPTLFLCLPAGVIAPRIDPEFSNPSYAAAESPLAGDPNLAELNEDLRMEEYLAADFPASPVTAEPFLGDPLWMHAMRVAMAPYAPASIAVEAHFYARGSILDIFVMRGVTWLYMLVAFASLYGWVVLAYMLVGASLMKSSILQRPLDNLPLLRRVIPIGLVLGGSFTGVSTYIVMSEGVEGPWWLVQLSAQHLGAVGMSFAYISILAWVGCRFGGTLLAAPFMALGRMAFTTYLGQTLFFTTLFYSYGGGLFGRFGYAPLVAFAVGFLVLQAIFAILWQRRFRFGPMEYLWRCATYGRWLPMRLAPGASPAE